MAEAGRERKRQEEAGRGRQTKAKGGEAGKKVGNVLSMCIL